MKWRNGEDFYNALLSALGRSKTGLSLIHFLMELSGTELHDYILEHNEGLARWAGCHLDKKYMEPLPFA
jgi:hypothetical protein